MKANLRFLIIIAVLFLMIPSVSAAGNYSDIINPTPFGNTSISWRINDISDDPVDLYWLGAGKALAESETYMTFTILEVGDDILGELSLGNVTIVGNDTDIALDLTLSIWSFSYSFLPGLIIEIGEENISNLNQTAYSAAERVAGNYMNGTIVSAFEEVTIVGMTYDCITFTYQQDDVGILEPQSTYLAYDITNGVLVKAETSVTFSTPYLLSLELVDVVTPLAIGPMILVGVGFVIIAVVLVFQSKMRK